MANPFSSEDMAGGYASARPPVHQEVIHRLRSHLPTFDRALDVGCGAGLSTKALSGLARICIGLEPVESMARRGPSVAAGACFVVGTAEALPVRERSVDIIAAAGSLNYADLDAFFPEAARALAKNGWLVVYDFSPGRRFPNSTSLDEWYGSFAACFPSPPNEARHLDPEILGQLHLGFRVVSFENFEIALTLTPDFYLEYILTETNVAFAMRNGVSIDDIRSWCAQTLKPVWAGQDRVVLFNGYFACLQLSRFEQAVDAVVTGDIGALGRLLSENPELIHARSTREHRATLLHYTAANGVEQYRQTTPGNAVDIAKMLLAAGADVDAVAETYGGGTEQTTLNLLVSSCHPAAAGLQCALAEVLLDYGAAINGVADDASPLRTALAFHYTKVAEVLARRGARVDTVLTAAGLGREDVLMHLPGDRDLAMVSAAAHGRVGAVELLLRSGVDPGAKDARQFTALHWAAYYGHLEVVRLLLAWKAPLEARNCYGGTPLGQTIWATMHQSVRPHHRAIIELLKERE